jgi:hypothetical protein
VGFIILPLSYLHNDVLASVDVLLGDRQAAAYGCNSSTVIKAGAYQGKKCLEKQIYPYITANCYQLFDISIRICKTLSKLIDPMNIEEEIRYEPQEIHGIYKSFQQPQV